MLAESATGGASARRSARGARRGALRRAARAGRAATRPIPTCASISTRASSAAAACARARRSRASSSTRSRAAARRRASPGAADAFADHPCVSCGACVSPCPTGAITDVDRERGAPRPTRVVRTTCGYCGVGCQLDVHVGGGSRAANRRRRRGPSTAGTCASRVATRTASSRHPDRLTHAARAPRRRARARDLGRGDRARSREVRAARADASPGCRRRAAPTRRTTCSRSGCAPGSAPTTSTAARASVTRRRGRACARRSAPARRPTRSPTSSAPTCSSWSAQHAPRRTRSSARASGRRCCAARGSWSSIRAAPSWPRSPTCTCSSGPGTNVPLLNALACVLVEEGLVDRAFVAARDEGWAEFVDVHPRRTRPRRTAAVTGVPADAVRAAARLYGAARRPMMMHGLGVTEHYQGSEAVMLLCNLALLAGAVGRPGVGVNPLRGQNNVQGAADMGCQPDLLDRLPARRRRQRCARASSASGGARCPRRAAARSRDVRRGARRRGARRCSSSARTSCRPIPTRAHRAALDALEFLVVQELFLSETAKLAHVVLPGASFLEKDGTFTNGERRIQRVRAALDPPGERARRLANPLRPDGGDRACRSRSAIRRRSWTRSRASRPIFAGVSYARLEGDGLQWPVPDAEPSRHADPPRRQLPAGARAPLARSTTPSPSLARRAAARCAHHGSRARALQRRHDDAPHANLALCPADGSRSTRTTRARAGSRRRSRERDQRARRGARDRRLTDRVPPGHRVPQLPLPRDGDQRADE